MSHEDAAAAATALTRWLLDVACGALPGNAVRAVHTEHAGLGLVTDAPLVAGTTVLTIPIAALIHDSDASAAAQRIVPQLSPHFDNNPAIALACMLLLRSLDPADVTATTYCAALPETCPTPVLFETRVLDRLANLTAAPVFAHARDIATALRALVLTPSASLTPFGSALMDASAFTSPADLCARLAWAYAMVESRAFRPFPSHPDRIALVPFGDLLNHSSVPGAANISHRLSPAGDVLQFVATRDVPAGTPLVMKYNDLSAADELVYYGFCEPETPFDALQIGLTLPESDPPALRQLKSAVLRGPIENFRLVHTVNRDCDGAVNMLLSLRVVVATWEELVDVAGARVDDKSGDLDLDALQASAIVQGLGEHNDSAAYAALKQLLSDMRDQLLEVTASGGWPTDDCRVHAEGQVGMMRMVLEYFDLA
ncbi:hypothetical protein BC828DRAFT_379860 [Blastocladiella britannica]|nr:hypothetical protein BC828DRAFT_379860 [Blastocladiella britannica]